MCKILFWHPKNLNFLEHICIETQILNLQMVLQIFVINLDKKKIKYLFFPGGSLAGRMKATRWLSAALFYILSKKLPF